MTAHGRAVRHIGDRVKEARIELDLSCNDLARRANLGRGVVSRLENGDRLPRLDALQNLAAALGVSLQWLLTEEGPRIKSAPADLPRLAEAARLAREDRVDERAVAAVLARTRRSGDEDRSTLWWVDEIRHEARQR
jgi:transcriptional regulator with XRE-family HTH domain